MARKKSLGVGCGAALVAVLLVAAFGIWHSGLIGQAPDQLDSESGQAAQLVEHIQSVVESDKPYVYSQLDEESRGKYRILLDALESRESRAYPEADMDGLSRIRECVMADYPGLFYVDGVRLLTESDSESGQVSNVSVEGRYSYSPDEVDAMGRQLEAALATCLAGLPDDADDYGKAKHLYEYLAEHVEYDHAAASGASGESEAPSGQTAYDALVSGRAVCAGYARAYQLLLHRLGIPCVYVSGMANGESHAWCVALLDGEWYFVDPTWGDPQYLDEGGQASDSGRIDYGYLCVTGDDIASTHAIDCPYPLPDCTSAVDNYYVREGLFLSGADIEAVGVILQEAASRGDSSAAFRCAAYEDFIQLQVALFDEQEVYRFISGSTCRYSLNDSLRTIEVFF